jgi:hypothetical protein
MRAQRKRIPTHPDLTPEGKEALLLFLSWCHQAALKGESQCLRGAAVDPTGQMQRNAAYWHNVASGMRWAMGRLRSARTARALGKAGGTAANALEPTRRKRDRPALQRQRQLSVSASAAG